MDPPFDPLMEKAKVDSMGELATGDGLSEPAAVSQDDEKSRVACLLKRTCIVDRIKPSRVSQRKGQTDVPCTLILTDPS